MRNRQIHNLDPGEVLRHLHTREAGLGEHEVRERLSEVGPNTLEVKHRFRVLKNLGRQFTNFFTILLDISAVICFIADHIQPDEGMNLLGWALLGVSVLNALFSFVQEYRAERAMEELQKFLPQQVLVRRDGEDREILAQDLVPGDVLELREGDKVPADARLIEAQDLIVNNAPLTGEAKPVRLTEAAQGGLLTESVNVLFAGCMVKKGRGRAAVFATGGRTEFGKIATLSHEVKRAPSPLERETAHMVRVLTVIAVAMGATFFLYGVFTGRSWWVNLVFMMGIIVANVPEGLLPTFTLSLAMGSLRMAKRNVLVKGLNAVEALGAVHVICTDKTGTLTQNRMAVTSVRDPRAGNEAAPADHANVLAMALSASDVHVGDELGGDPLDVAIAQAYGEAGGDVPGANDAIVRRFSFDDALRRAGGVAHGEDGYRYCVKGAWESLRPLLGKISVPGQDGPATVDEDGLARADAVVHRMATSGQRVIAVAYRDLDGPPAADVPQDAFEHDLVLAGFLGAEDPIRPEVPGAVEQCHAAGIGVVMITGDHPDTAEAVARRVGIVRSDIQPGGATLTGVQLARISKRELMDKL
ncbi:MAG: cation-transporting P-type ATPase, partial [Alphaproteobacteria bacterium]|nr:cation-transporting P-type ATPase [Alphaproteobacteria bacterium]